MSASPKIDSVWQPEAALNLMKERCQSLVDRLGVDPATLAKVIGGVLGGIIIMVWLAIVLYKHRKARAQTMSKPRANRHERQSLRR